MDQKKGWKGLFQQLVKELAIEDTAEYKDMMRMSHAVFQRILSDIEQDITRKQVLGGNKVISPKERLALTISPTQNCLLPSFHRWWPWLRLLNCACAWSTMLKQRGKWLQLRLHPLLLTEHACVRTGRFVTVSGIPDRHANINPVSCAQFLTSPASRGTDKSRIPSIHLSFSRFPQRILVKSRIPKIPFPTLLNGSHEGVVSAAFYKNI